MDYIINLKHLDGGISMGPRIVEKDKFMVVGMKYYGSNNNNEIPELRISRQIRRYL